MSAESEKFKIFVEYCEANLIPPQHQLLDSSIFISYQFPDTEYYLTILSRDQMLFLWRLEDGAESIPFRKEEFSGDLFEILPDGVAEFVLFNLNIFEEFYIED